MVGMALRPESEKFYDPYSTFHPKTRQHNKFREGIPFPYPVGGGMEQIGQTGTRQRAESESDAIDNGERNKHAGVNATEAQQSSQGRRPRRKRAPPS